MLVHSKPDFMQTAVTETSQALDSWWLFNWLSHFLSDNKISSSTWHYQFSKHPDNFSALLSCECSALLSTQKINAWRADKLHCLWPGKGSRDHSRGCHLHLHISFLGMHRGVPHSSPPFKSRYKTRLLLCPLSLLGKHRQPCLSPCLQICHLPCPCSCLLGPLAPGKGRGKQKGHKGHL